MASNVGKLIMETILGLITTAFAFVAGLAWNEAIQALIQQFVGTGSALTSLFTYAIIVTVIAVIVTVILARFAAKMGIELNEQKGKFFPFYSTFLNTTPAIIYETSNKIKNFLHKLQNNIDDYSQYLSENDIIDIGFLLSHLE